MCIFFHELAHITRCHLPFYREQMGKTSYLELPMARLTAEESQLRLLLELDADHIGAANHLIFWRGMYEHFSRRYPIPLSAELCWAISLAMCFFIMHSFDAGTPLLHYPSHPPPMMRYLHLMNRSLFQEHGMYIGSQETAMKGFKAVSDRWAKNKLPKPIEYEELSKEMFDELQALLRKFESDCW